MRERLTQGLLLAAAAINLVPATAVASRRRVEDLYDIGVPDRDHELLLRHRAALFGLVGGALVHGAADPAARPAAIALGTAAAASYSLLARRIGTENPSLVRVDRADRAIVAALAMAAVLERGRPG